MGNVGWLGASLAPSGVTTHTLSKYLGENYGLSLAVDSRPVELLASEDALYFVTFETPSTVCAGLTSFTSGKIAAHVLILPYDYEQPTKIDAYDFSGDGHVSPIDAVLVINADQYCRLGTAQLAARVLASLPGIDLNGDGELSPIDAVLVINYLNAQTQPPAQVLSS